MNQLEFSENNTLIRKKRSKYKPVDNSLREKLVDLVINQNNQLKRASDQLDLNYSTAKTIIRIWKNENRCIKKKKKRNFYKTKLKYRFKNKKNAEICCLDNINESHQIPHNERKNFPVFNFDFPINNQINKINNNDIICSLRNNNKKENNLNELLKTNNFSKNYYLINKNNSNFQINYDIDMLRNDDTKENNYNNYSSSFTRCDISKKNLKSIK